MSAGRIWFASLAALFLVLAGVWAYHNRLAAAVVVGGLVWIVGVAGGITAVVEWFQQRRKLADAEDHIADLEARLTNPATATTVRVPSMTRHLSLVQSDDEYWLRLYDENGNHR